MTETRLEKILLGNACILISTIFWGVNYPFTKALVPEFMTAQGVVAFRLIGGCALFWLASFFIRNSPIPWRDFRKIIIGGFALFGCIYLFVVALKYGGAIDIAIIMTLQPAFVMLLEVAFLHRRPSLEEYAGLIISFIGAALVIISDHAGTEHAANLLMGDCLAVCSGLCFAIYLVILQKPTREFKPVSLLRWVFLFSALPALFLVPGMPAMHIWQTNGITPWLEIGFIVVCPTFLAYLLMQPASRAIGSVLVAVYQYLTPVVAALVAVWMGQENLRWTQVAAMLLIMAGMLLTNFGKKKQKS